MANLSFVKCKLCGSEYLKKGKLALCSKCYKRICRGKHHRAKYAVNGRHHSLSADEYMVLTKKCAVCGRSDYVVLHHIVPVSRGGLNEYENYVGLCGCCHALVHVRQVSLSKLLWCYNKSIPIARSDALARRRRNF